VREHLCQLGQEHLDHHGLEVLELLVRLLPVELEHLGHLYLVEPERLYLVGLERPYL
jgi:hypothetical protein